MKPVEIAELQKKSIRYVKGVGEARVALFEKLGIRTLYDLLTYYPKD